MKKWLCMVLLVAFFPGFASAQEVKVKSHLEQALEEIAEIQSVAKKSDAEIEGYLKGMYPAVKKAVESGLRKLAWKISKPGENAQWWVIYEHKRYAVASAYLLKADDPPADATILESKERRL